MDGAPTVHPTSDDESSTLFQELRWLSSEIRRHDDLYYSSGETELSDEDFDALVRREEVLAKAHPDVLKVWQEESGWGVAATRSGRVGANTKSESPATATTKITRRHLQPMLSLDNVHNVQQLQNWLKRIPNAVQWNEEEEEDSTQVVPVTILTEPKLDGVSLSLRYQRQANEKSLSVLWASTRGDGKQGQDVTAAVRSIPNIPASIKSTFSTDQLILEIRGEVVLPRSSFLRLQETARQEQAEKDDTTDNEDETDTKPSTPSLPSFSNARNAASGILLRKMSTVPQDQEQSDQLRSLLRFYAYDLVMDNGDTSPLSGLEIRNMLTDFGFHVPDPLAVTELELSSEQDLFVVESEKDENVEGGIIEKDPRFASMLSYYHALEEYRDALAKSASVDKKKKKKTIKKKDYAWGDFDMDGCVHKVSQSALRQAMGTSMKSPKWAIAHKFPPMAAVSQLRDIIVQVGRTGALTPVAVLEPVQVGGVTIQRATLHNFGHMKFILGGEDTEIRKGTPILVRRAGDVIPQVVQRLDGNSTGDTSNKNESSMFLSLEPPTKCPACDSPVVWEEPSQNNTDTVGQVIRCGGIPLLCTPRAVMSLGHAYSRDALDVTGLSEARIQQLMDAGYLRYPGDLFRLKEKDWEQIGELPGWGTKSCQNLQGSLEEVATKGISLGRFIFSLGIRQVGKHSSDLVAESFGTVDSFLQSLEASSKWKPPEIDSSGEKETNSTHPFASLDTQNGIGPVLIQSLLAFSKEKELVSAVQELAAAVKILEERMPPSTKDGKTKEGKELPWSGYVVVFTGSIPNMTRSQAQTAAKALGAKSTPGTLSPSTSLVVYGDKAGKKLEKAQDLGVEIMRAEDFVQLVKGHNGLG